MSAIKDLVDLLTQLVESVQDRKTKDQLLPLREKVLEVREAQFEMEQRHAEELSELKEEHAAQVAELKAEVTRLVAENDRPKVTLTFREDTGTYVDSDSGLHYCTYCLKQLPPTEQPMQDHGHGWLCPLCSKSYNDPSRPRPRRRLSASRDLDGGSTW